MNYASLLAQVQDITQNFETSFVANIPLFVQRAERRIHMEAGLPSSRANSTGVTVAGSRDITVPATLISMESLGITVSGAEVNLLPKSAPFLDEMYPVVATQDVPKYYARYDVGTIKMAPTPAAAYPVTFHYFAMPTSIVTAGSSWLGDNYEQTLLYGVLLEAYVFMKGSSDVMAYYKTGYDAGMAEIKAITSATKLNGFRG